MAYIRQRGKTWSYTVEGPPDPVTNERNQIVKGGFRKESDAIKAAARLEAEIEEGSFFRESPLSFREYAERWFGRYRTGVYSRRKPSKNTIRLRTYQLATLFKHFDTIRIGRITTEQYLDALITMRESLDYETAKGAHGVARMIFLRAMQDKIIKEDPSRYAKVPPPDEEDFLPKYMEKEGLAEFLDLAKQRGLGDDYLVFLLLAYTGMRLGELCVLTWRDVDFEDKTISINGTLYNPSDLNTEYEVTSPKTATSKRTLDVDDFILGHLKAHKDRQDAFIQRHKANWHRGNFIFARTDHPRNVKVPPYGYPTKRRTVEVRMTRLMQWFPIQNGVYTPHSLRHTHTSLCAEAGVSLEAIMQRLGHKDDKVTRLVYLHTTRTVKREAAAKFGALMENVVKMSTTDVNILVQPQ